MKRLQSLLFTIVNVIIVIFLSLLNLPHSSPPIFAIAISTPIAITTMHLHLHIPTLLTLLLTLATVASTHPTSPYPPSPPKPDPHQPQPQSQPHSHPPTLTKRAPLPANLFVSHTTRAFWFSAVLALAVNAYGEWRELQETQEQLRLEIERGNEEIERVNEELLEKLREEREGGSE